MSCINESTESFWNQLATDLEAMRPSVGKGVYVGRGKHAGRFGVVSRHQRSRFSNAYRYGSDANHHMRDMAGTYGWTCRVSFGDGDYAWVRADHVSLAEPVR